MSSLPSWSSGSLSPSQCADKDNSFGPYAGACRGGFDFTLLFEETILFILPLVSFLLIAPFRLSYLARKQVKVVPSLLLYVKLVCRAKTPVRPTTVDAEVHPIVTVPLYLIGKHLRALTVAGERSMLLSLCPG